jgi:hypothetical protein
VRTADGALARQKLDPDFGDDGGLNEVWLGAGEARPKVCCPGLGEVGRLKLCWPGLGDAGSDGNLFTPGFGDEGRPTRGVCELSDTADVGSGSVGTDDGFLEWLAMFGGEAAAPSLSSMLCEPSGE